MLEIWAIEVTHNSAGDALLPALLVQIDLHEALLSGSAAIVPTTPRLVTRPRRLPDARPRRSSQCEKCQQALEGEPSRSARERRSATGSSDLGTPETVRVE